MSKRKFTEIPQPFICTILSDSNPTDSIRSIRLSDYDGTDAYEMNLMMLRKEFLNEKDLRSVFQSTVKPIIVCHYRWDYEAPLDMGEEERFELLLNTVRWGASGIDLEADAYDPSSGPPRVERGGQGVLPRPILETKGLDDGPRRDPAPAGDNRGGAPPRRRGADVRAHAGPPLGGGGGVHGEGDGGEGGRHRQGG